MRLNGSQCSSVKETTAMRVLRSTKVLSAAEQQHSLLSDISNLAWSGRQRKNDHAAKAGKCARRVSSLPKEVENGNTAKADGLVKLRRSNVPCQPLPCTTIGRKRVVGVEGDCNTRLQDSECATPPHSSRSRDVYTSSPEFETSPSKRPASPSPPSTPVTVKSLGMCETANEGVENGDNSPLEELPFDLLVRIVCCLQHDELKPLLLVSGRLRHAVTVARQFHFNFTTPGRGRKVRLGPLNFGRVYNSLRGFEAAVDSAECPRTPNAPRHAPNSPMRRLSDIDLKPFAPPLFQESSTNFQYSGSFFRKSRPMCRTVPSHRVLFNEDELCQAVAQNTI